MTPPERFTISGSPTPLSLLEIAKLVRACPRCSKPIVSIVVAEGRSTFTCSASACKREYLHDHRTGRISHDNANSTFSPEDSSSFALEAFRSYTAGRTPVVLDRRGFNRTRAAAALTTRFVIRARQRP